MALIRASALMSEHLSSHGTALHSLRCFSNGEPLARALWFAFYTSAAFTTTTASDAITLDVALFGVYMSYNPNKV